jgi:hypothetical protein
MVRALSLDAIMQVAEARMINETKRAELAAVRAAVGTMRERPVA